MAVEPPRASVSHIRQPKQRQRDACEPHTEFFQRPAAANGLGQSLGQFIEFVVHNFPFGSCCYFFREVIFMPGGIVSPFTMSVLLNGVPPTVSAAGLS